jgi:hypothetical protein
MIIPFEHCIIDPAPFVAVIETPNSQRPNADHRRRCPQDSQNVSATFTPLPHCGQNDTASSIAGNAVSTIGMLGARCIAFGVVGVLRSMAVAPTTPKMIASRCMTVGIRGMALKAGSKIENRGKDWKDD